LAAWYLFVDFKVARIACFVELMGMDVPKNFVAEPFSYHEEVEFTVESLTNLGMGVGRVDGWVVMVPFVIPGERVRVRIFRNFTNYSEADIVEVLEASPDRVEARCGLYQTCGGCQYQHIDYTRQLAEKTRHVEELMQKIGEIDHPVEMAIGSPKVYHYRSKITPHYNRPNRDGSQPIGFLRHGRRNQIVDVPQCPIATEAINDALPEARDEARRAGGKKRRQRGGTLLLRDVVEGIVTEPQAIVSERVGELTFQFKVGEFFQNNPFILPQMVDYVWAQANAKICGIKNARFLIGKAEAIFNGLQFPAKTTAMVIDPPRKGCDESFRQQLLQFRPQRVVYVSCDPATQARDLKQFIEGGYKITRIQPFDLFPHTRHIENVVSLSLED
jgi:23S rRNA (uracil1939-C5)-methyltransferase/tRNA (uracil-5-)-methyltransferase